MTLEEYGLYKLKKVPVADTSVGDKIKYKNVKGEMIWVTSEKDILDLPPEKRKF